MFKTIKIRLISLLLKIQKTYSERKETIWFSATRKIYHHNKTKDQKCWSQDIRNSDTVGSDLPIRKSRLEGKSNRDSVISFILPNWSGTGISQALESFDGWEEFVQDGDRQTITIKDRIERARSRSPGARAKVWNVGLTLLGGPGHHNKPLIKFSMWFGVRLSQGTSKSEVFGVVKEWSEKNAPYRSAAAESLIYPWC